MIKKYTELRNLLKSIGINFSDSGDSENNRGKQVSISIDDEQSTSSAITFYFNVSLDGTETFICQE